MAAFLTRAMCAVQQFGIPESTNRRFPMFMRFIRKVQAAQQVRAAIIAQQYLSDADYASINVTRDTYVASVKAKAAADLAKADRAEAAAQVQHIGLANAA